MDASHIETIRTYLTAASERRLDDAQRMLAPGALILFPQGRFADLLEMAQAMKGRYRNIDKVHETWDVSAPDPETSVVTTTGTLFGTNNHGVEFEGIRFCDRFVLRDGLITEQHVWNDLAESGVLDREA